MVFQFSQSFDTEEANLYTSPQNPRPQYRSFSYLSGVVLTCTLGSFSWGYSMGVFNTCHEQILYQLPIPASSRPVYQALITTLIPLGAAIGACLMGILSSVLGRRRMMILTDVVTIAAVILTIQLNLTLFLSGRFLLGICAGLQSTVNAIYIQEMVTKDTRGIFGSWHQILMTLGVLTSYIAGIGIPDSHSLDHLTTNWWRYMFSVPLIVAVLRLYLILEVITYDTPKSYIAKKAPEEAFRVIAKIYDDDLVEPELTKMLQEVRTVREKNHSGFSGLCSDYRKPLLVGVFLAMFTQLTGQNAMIFYSNDIFKRESGTTNANDVNHNQRTAYTIMMGLMYFLPAIFSGPLIDKAGRRIVFLWGNGVMVSMHALFLLSRYLDMYGWSVVAVLVFQLSFGFTIGPIIWIYLPEILPSEGVSVAAFTKWLFVNFVAWTFPMMVHHGLGIDGTFAFFAICSLMFEVFIYFYVKETKGKSHAEMKSLL
eukprot:TRINITY_DN23635_c0_g1_i2.p1 TRINITY_DN23635_c0_g1~~TRINITY_DN23635_c0_g1_i2.p1  ORF type:complete len:482 (-),score=7.31 TRINITY_DN23635_c0_g1_i2:248-1693(-)